MKITEAIDWVIGRHETRMSTDIEATIHELHVLYHGCGIRDPYGKSPAPTTADIENAQYTAQAIAEKYGSEPDWKQIADDLGVPLGWLVV